MATTAPKAASAGTINYAPDTRLDMTITVPVAYDLSTVTAVFELESRNTTVFRYDSDQDSNISISGQVITFAVAPSTDSLDSLDNTLADVLTEGVAVKYNIDLGQTGSDVVDYRI